MATHSALVRQYQDKGYVLAEGLLSTTEVGTLNDAINRHLERVKGKTVSDDVFDLDDDHTPEWPRVRRIKEPYRVDPVFKAVASHAGILSVLEQLIGPDIRYHHSKINFKTPRRGAPVEWHQDWAFYPHTNDDMLAAGILLDDCGEDNGPLRVVPGSHRGPIWDHHVEGRFCGAIDPHNVPVDFDSAESLTGPAGSVTFHHVRAIHGSAENRSSRPRTLFLLGYAAADAWPLLGSETDEGYEAFHERMVAGVDTITPRMEAIEVRAPLPRPLHEGSIYENQRALARILHQDPVVG